MPTLQWQTIGVASVAGKTTEVVAAAEAEEMAAEVVSQGMGHMPWMPDRRSF